MMQLHLLRLFISAFLYCSVCFLATLLINPQSIVNFVGPAAALTGGLLLVWRITPIVAALLVTPVVAWSLNSYFALNANIAVMVIATLAIILQAAWTKQLVTRFIRYQKWLTSRKHLFFFLLRIGPIASLVSASAVLIIAMLDNQVVNGSFLYTFINTWSASMLMAVFFIPLILLSKSSEHIKLTKRLFVGFTSVLGGIAILLLFKTSQYEQQHSRQAVFEQSILDVERLINSDLTEVGHQITSLSAFFKASKHVTLTEFNLFSESIYSKKASIKALEWAPIVDSSQRQAFEQQGSTMLSTNYAIKERLISGKLSIAKVRSKYAPLLYIYPRQGNQQALGLDVFTNPNHVISMQEVIESREIIASAPITLVQDELAKPAMLFSTAIYSPKKTTEEVGSVKQRKLSLQQNGELIGFVVAVVQIDELLQGLAEQKQDKVSFFIDDITNKEPMALFGKQSPSANRYTETFTMNVYSRIWQVTLVESQPWFSQEKSWQAWAVLIGGTIGSVLFQMLVLMMAAYSSELSLQVDLKTRALISAKEKSEQKSLAKSHFLTTLNKELRMPLLAIKSFVEQLKKKGINNKQVTGISHAGSNVALLLDTMMDLSDIESGKVIAKKDCFDFYGFLQRTESVFKASNVYEGKSIYFLIDDSVPHYINSDELYIQKLLNALIESAHSILKSDGLRLSIKLHQHKQADASLFFILSPLNPLTSDSTEANDESVIQNELSTSSTAMAMAIKYSQLLQGDTSLGTLSTGSGVLSASIRVTVSSIEEQEAHQSLTFDLMS